MKKLAALVLALAMLAVLTACGGGSSTPAGGSDPLAAAQEEFEFAQSDFSAAWESLREAAERGQSCLDGVAAELDDPSLPELLRGYLADAQSVLDSTELPEISSDDAEDILRQAQELRDKTAQLWALRDEIDYAIELVESAGAEQAEAKQMEGLTAETAYVGTAETANGYKAEYTISVTHWIRASDSESLQLAWEGVGGSDEYPALSRFQSNTNDGFNSVNAAAAFGTVSFRNVTEGFDITEENPVTFGISLSVNRDIRYSNYSPKLYIQYANESKQFSFNDYPSMSPLMKKNAWGPVPFMIVCPNAFTPNDPDGAAVLDDFQININGIGSGCYFTITPSW